MLSKFKVEITLALLLLLTLVAIVGERWILRMDLVVEPSDSYGAVVYDDRVAGGESTSELFADTDAYRWQCTLRESNTFPFCGFELIFDPIRQNGLDLRQYDTVRLWLEYEGEASAVRVYLRNFNRAYSVPDENDSTKYNQVEFSASLLSDGFVEFSLNDFFVANWWTQQRDIPPEMAHPEFKNIVVLEVSPGTKAGPGVHRFRLERVEFVGQRISSLQWYEFILGIWVAIALVFLAARIVALKKEVVMRRERERELMEINKLLDVRGKTLEEMARTDPLTGAFNREGIKEAIRAGLSEWRRERKPMTLIVLDIDHFKHINDTHGHFAGDQVLTQLSELVQNNIRNSDRFARWGGEEFLLVCRDTVAEDGEILAEKLRNLVAAYQFARGISVTISCGVAVLREQESLDNLFVRADKALYAAKVQGRNRVVLADAMPRAAGF